MAEAIVNARLGAEWEAVSAGTKPAGYIHPRALAALSEIGHEFPTLAAAHRQVQPALQLIPVTLLALHVSRHACRLRRLNPDGSFEVIHFRPQLWQQVPLCNGDILYLGTQE